METGLLSVPSRRGIKKTDQNIPPKTGCSLSVQTIDLPSDFTCPVRVKEEADQHQPEYFRCPLLQNMKEESVELEKFIKKEQHDDSNLTLTGEASRQCNDNLPHGLIPLIEMEDDECEAENVNTRRKTFLNKNITVKQTNYHCVKRRDGRMPLKMHTHSKGGEAFWCETCGKEFTRFDLLGNHRRRHGRKRPYPCEQCGMMLTKPAYLKIHLRRHAGERAFPCDQCDKRFFDKYDLGVHQRDHTGERPYVCRECGKSFKRIYILNKHKKTHSNEKSFKCNVCGKAYKYSYSYRLHMKNHPA